MRKLFSVVLVTMLLVGPGCGGDTHQSLAASAVSTMKDFVDTLDNVKDEASAQSNKSKLQSLATKMKDINQRQEKLPKPTADEMKAMGDKYGPQMEDLQKRVMGDMFRIMSDPKIMAVLHDIDFEKMN